MDRTQLSKIQRIRFFLSVGFLCCFIHLFGQQMDISVSHQPLNMVLVALRDEYNLQLSFNDEILARYTVTCDRSFENPLAALSFLLNDVPFTVEQIEEVYVISYLPPPLKNPIYQFQGHVLDAANGERLPFCNIQLNDKGLVTNQNGQFAFTASDSIIDIKIAYLGYEMVDSTASASTQLRFGLLPRSVEIKEIEIIDDRIEWSPKLGNEAGQSRINQQVAMFLPGFGDNAVFNLIRLQPGVLAAGEQAADLIIWGGQEGQSMVRFDGFTVFGLKNFNDNISAINPYMVKDIKILKGGYSADYGERVSGIIDITGIDGNKIKPTLNLNLDNMTFNGMASLPLFKTTSLVIATRQTYYALYNNSTLQRGNDTTVIAIRPDYKFSDYNLKYSGNLGSRFHFALCAYQGQDDYTESIRPETLDSERKGREIATRDQNLQQARSAQINYRFSGGLQVAVSGNRSDLASESKFRFTETWLRRNFSVTRETSSSNKLEETNLELSLSKNFQLIHQLKAALGYTIDDIGFSRDSSGIQLNSDRDAGKRYRMFVTDKIHITDQLKAEPGIRAVYHSPDERWYLQPRFNLSLKPQSAWQLMAAWGIYNQFISKTLQIDENGNFRYYWTLSDGESIPVLRSIHYVGSISYTPSHKFLVNVEGYYKLTEGLVRFQGNLERNRLIQGDGRSRGVDVLVKSEQKYFSAWLAYTLQKTEERYPATVVNTYLSAPHDQRHELKLTGILKLFPFYLSANYVYGSGFPDPRILFKDQVAVYHIPYQRLDVAAVYKKSFRFGAIETGISVLNVTNHKNLKYSNFTYARTSENSDLRIQSEAVPFTPTLFLTLEL